MGNYLKLFRNNEVYEEYKETHPVPDPPKINDYPKLGLPGYVVTYEAPTERYFDELDYSDYGIMVTDYKNGVGTIIFQNNQTTAENYFSGRNVTSVRFPSTVKSIYCTAFWYCNDIKEVHFESPTPVNLACEDDPFWNVPDWDKVKIYVPKDSVDAYKAHDYWKDFNILPDDPYYGERYVQIEDTCIDYSLYKQEELEVTHDGGQTWEKTGEIKQTMKQYHSAACGYAERWVEDGTTCKGYNLYKQEKQQVSHDSGTTWEDNGQTRYGALIETLSTTCGYDPSSASTITYYGSSKMSETTSEKTAGLKTNAFDVPIGSHTFSNGVGTITFMGTVTSIGAGAFYSSPFTKMVLPDSITFIGKMAFSDAGYGGNIKQLVVNSVTPPTMEKGCISYSSGNCPTLPSTITNIYVPSESVSAYKAATNWSEFSSKITAIV